MTPPQAVDVSRLSAMVRAKRAGRPLRLVAVEVGGVTASTLSRVERECVPDLDTFMRLCAWLGVSADQFRPAIQSEPGEPMSMPDVIEANLRADRLLPAEAINALSQMIRFAYRAAAEGQFRDREE